MDVELDSDTNSDNDVDLSHVSHTCVMTSFTLAG
jgi:hypothetical protein